MPFNQDLIHLNNSEIHLLYYNEYDPYTYLDQLTEAEKERYFTFFHIKRKREFVATRILRHRLFGFEHIHYDPHGAPYIENEGYISISHAEGVVGIAFCKDYKIGLDLETVRDKASILSSKFLNEQEKKQFNSEDPFEMTRIWSIKEVLYKLAGRKEIIFKTDLLVDADQEDQFIGTIINPDHILKMKIRSFKVKDLVISLNISACEKF